jgi:hypothetical protein
LQRTVAHTARRAAPLQEIADPFQKIAATMNHVLLVAAGISCFDEETSLTDAGTRCIDAAFS